MYVLKNGYYAASTWIQDTDGKWYYFDMGGYMAADENTADGYYVGPDGVWNGQPSTISDNVNLGPGMTLSYGREESNNTWKYKQKDGTYVTEDFLDYVKPLIQGDYQPVMVDGIPRHLVLK